MTKKITALLIAVFAFSCGDDSYKKAENPTEAGTEFIRAVLNGNYQKAEFYLLKDEDNLRLFYKNRTDYNALTAEAKRSYREANIRPVSITAIDSTHTRYIYWNTANPSDTFSLAIVRVNGEWLVDLKSIIER